MQVLLVVKRRLPDRHARHLHRLQHRERDHVAGAPDVPRHLLEDRLRRRRRELPGDRPARLTPDHAELALQVEVVDLHDDAVDLEVEPVAALLPGLAGRHDLVDGVEHLDVLVHAEAMLAQPLERLGVRVELEPVGGADAVAPHRQRPRRGQLRVELADRARGGVARVRVGGLAGSGSLLVERREGGQRQVDLTAHLEQPRRVLDPQRDRADRAQVLRHVLAHLAVAARSAADERAVLVDERDREPVDLWLGHEVHLAHLDALTREIALRAEHPCGELVLVAGVGERQHRLQMPDLVELVERLTADALGGRVRREQIGMVPLEVTQLVQQRVVLDVGDLGVVEDVVAVSVVLELLAELAGPPRRLLWYGAQTSRAAGRSSRSSSKPDRRSMPAWSFRSKCSGVTAMKPSAIAAKSVPSSGV